MTQDWRDLKDYVEEQMVHTRSTIMIDYKFIGLGIVARKMEEVETAKAIQSLIEAGY